MKEQNSIHSPKNKYNATITYEVAIAGIASVESYSFNDLKEAISFCEKAGRSVINKDINKCNSFNLKIRENKKEYPDFEWVEVYNENYFNKDEERKRFCIELTKCRVRRGLTQEQLADKIGIQKQNVSRIENGNFSIGIDMVLRIVDALGGKIIIQYK